MPATSLVQTSPVACAAIARSVRCWHVPALITLLVLGVAAAHTLAEGPARAAAPVAVVSARDFDRLTAGADRVLTTAGAAMRAAQLRELLAVLNGLDGLGRGRPLGILAYLPAVSYDDRKVEPEFIVFLPIDSMEELQGSLSALQRIALAPRDESGLWELRALRTTIPLRVAGGYAFAALREELLADPLPDVAELTAAHEGHDLAVSLLRDGLPGELRDRAITDILLNLHRNAERGEPSDAGARATHVQIVTALGWLFDRSLRDIERVTLGLRLPPDADQLELTLAAVLGAETPLAEAVARTPAGDSLFRQLSGGESPLVISAGGALSGDIHRLAVDGVDRLRRDVERRMQADGTVNGPAAAPIREMLAAFAATATAGRVDACLVFDGDQPGTMLMLAAARLEQADEMAEALADFLPLIAETPAVADLEMNAIQVAGVKLHRLTLQEVRKQDEWLYGPDVGLYLGAGRNALWLALGGFDREAQIEALLQRPPPALEESAPSLLRVELRLKPWLAAGEGDGGRGPQWLKRAREAFADGGDRLLINLTVDGDGLRLQGTLEEGYIRFAGAGWRARQQPSNPGRSPNLAAPVLPE